MIIKKFLSGALFVLAVIPIVDSVVNVTLTGLEIIKGNWAIKVAQINNELQKINTPEEESTRVIGFSIPTEEEEEEEYE